MVHALGVALRATTLMASPLNAEAVCRLLSSNAIDGIINAVRAEAGARQKIVRSIMPDKIVTTKPEAFYAWLKLTNGWSADTFVGAAEDAGVAVTSFTMFEVGSLNHTDAVRICINGASDRPALEWALHQLKHLLFENVPLASSRRNIAV